MGWGVDSSGKKEDKTTVWSFCNWRQFPVSRYRVFKLVILIYVYSIFTFHMCYGFAWFYYFSHIINVCHNSLKNCANILCMIIDLCWLSISWWTSCCKFDDWHHYVRGICVYRMILVISEFILKVFKIIDSPISRFDFSLNICITPYQDRT